MAKFRTIRTTFQATAPIAPTPIAPTPIQPSPIAPSPIIQPSPIVQPTPEKPIAYPITPTPSPAIPPGGIPAGPKTPEMTVEEKAYYEAEIRKTLPPEYELWYISSIQRAPEGVSLEYMVHPKGEKPRKPRPIWGGKPWWLEGLPKGVEVTGVIETPEGFELTYKPIGEGLGPTPWTSEWFISGLEWTLGGGLEESIWSAMGLGEAEKKSLRPITKAYRGETLYEKYGVRVGLKSIEEFAYVPIGAYQVAESFWKPTTPTLVGAGVSYVLTGGRPEAFGPEVEKIGEHPGLLLGELVGEYFTGKAVVWGAGKVWKGVKYVAPQRIKEPIAYSVKFGRVAKAGEAIKMWKVEHLPSWTGSRLELWLAKRTAKAKIEASLIWGEEKFFLPGQFEVSESMQKIYKFTGLPIIYGKKATYGVIQVTRPTAFEQIAKGIERGLFPRMGTLSAQQILITKKVIPESFARQIAVTRTALTVPAKTTQKLVPILLPRIYTPTRLEPKQPEKIIAVPRAIEMPFEMERLKFKPLELLKPKAKEREEAIPVPRLVSYPALKQVSLQLPKQVQRQKQITIPRIPPPTLLTLPEPSLPVPPFLRAGGYDVSQLGKGFFGKWFKRTHEIVSPEKMAKSFGLPSLKKMRRKTKRGGLDIPFL